jgi:hypothetical protein
MKAAINGLKWNVFNSWIKPFPAKRSEIQQNKLRDSRARKNAKSGKYITFLFKAKPNNVYFEAAGTDAGRATTVPSSGLMNLAHVRTMR